MSKPVNEPKEVLCFLATLAGGQSCCGTDRDGESWLKILLSRQDAAVVLSRLDELQECFFVTLVPEKDAKRPVSRRPAH